MPLTMDRIRAALAEGLSPVCATCAKYWKGKDRGLPHCLGHECGSPLRGDTFHDYEGPLSEERFADWCFVCAQKSDYGVVVRGHKRLIGVCREHVSYFETMRPLSRAGVSRPDFKDGSTLVTLVQILGKRKKTLAEAIVDTNRRLMGAS